MPARCKAFTGPGIDSALPRCLPRTVSLVRGEEGHRRIPPIVAQSGGAVLGIELKDREKLHGGNSQVGKVGNFFDEPGKVPRFSLATPGARVVGEATHMQFIDYRLGKGAF